MNQTFVRATRMAAMTVLSTLLSGSAVLAAQESARRTNVPAGDEQFIRTAAETSMTQVDLGKLAEQKSQNPEVKKFAQMMVQDHAKLTEQLKQMGMSEGINLPTSSSRRDADARRSLATSSGPGFDRAYAQRALTDLERQIAEFKRGASTATKPAVKDFAERSLPMLESQLQQAKQLMGQTGR